MINNKDNSMICSLCGYKFQKDIAKCSGCPLNNKCKVICCPHCGYQMVDDSKIKQNISKIRRWLKWFKRTMY
jgi:hypothetical protein